MRSYPPGTWGRVAEMQHSWNRAPGGRELTRVEAGLSAAEADPGQMPPPGDPPQLSPTSSSHWFVFFLKKKKKCVFGCARSSLLGRFFSPCGKRGHSSSGTRASHHDGLLLPSESSRARGLQRWSSRALGAGSVAVAHRLSCPSARGTEPTSPALAGGFFATEPPGM